MCKEGDIGKQEGFSVSEDEEKGDSTMETVGPSAFDQKLFDLRENGHAIILVGETTRLEEVDTKRACGEYVALVAVLALGQFRACLLILVLYDLDVL